jgi:hypothetical protein
MPIYFKTCFTRNLEISLWYMLYTFTPSDSSVTVATQYDKYIVSVIPTLHYLVLKYIFFQGSSTDYQRGLEW